MAKATKALDLSSALDAAEESTGTKVSEMGTSDPFLPDDFGGFPEVPEGDSIPEVPTDEQPEASEAEQAEVGEADEEDDGPLTLADIDFGGEPEEPEKGSGEIDIYQTPVEVPNVGLVNVQELVNGYLRQADYTQKTQEIAEDRRFIQSDEFQNIRQLYNMLKEDTVGTVQRLASEVGITADTNVEGERVLPQFNQMDESKIEELVAQRVNEALQSRPEIQEVTRQQRVAQVAGEMDRIQRDYGEQFSEQDKIAILNNAVKSGTSLELTYLRMRRALDSRQAEKARVEGATNRTKRKGTSGSDDAAPPAKKGVEGAYERALWQIQNSE